MYLKRSEEDTYPNVLNYITAGLLVRAATISFEIK